MQVLTFISYAKKFLIALAAALGILTTALIDNTITVSEWIQVVIAFIAALGVYTVTNKKAE